MTKNEELNRLDAFIQTLPEDSYLRPWLTQERESIERAISNDVPLEHFCHGFSDLLSISRRLDEARNSLDKDVRQLNDQRRAIDAERRGLVEERARIAAALSKAYTAVNAGGKA